MKTTHPNLRQCQAIKWAAVVLYLLAYGLIYYTSSCISCAKVTDEMGALLAVRTTILTALFCITMWAMSRVLHSVRGARR